MHSFPRPDEPTLVAHREPVAGACPACGAEALASYRVLSEGGLWDVVKCGECLASVSRERGPRLGSLTPLGLTIR
jgi:vanillate/4-hydroxybenzoate decarboxylase subunit D